MYRRLAVAVIVFAMTASATVLPSSAPAATAAASCTGWKNRYVPPATIRVYRTYGPAAGRVQTVSFRSYVENTVAWEWPSAFPTASLRAGAIAAKQYGWYYAMTYRGGTSPGGACYDVKDTSADQVYRPETRNASVSQRAAVAATWQIAVRRSRNGVPGQFILTGYHRGSIFSCGAETNGFRLFQKGVYDCGRKGLTLEEIMRIYYGSTLEISDPGKHEISGGVTGDGGAVVPTEAGVDAHVYLSTGARFAAPSAPDAIPLADAVTLDRIAADIDGDGEHELIVLMRDGDAAERIVILRPTGAGYGDPESWWDSATAGVGFPIERDGKRAIRLVAGDFDADLVDDVGLLVGAEDPTQSTLYVLRANSTRTAFEAALTWWTGPLALGDSAVFAADVTGDGRADLVAETDGGEAGLVYWVAQSKAGGLEDGATQWYDGSALRRVTTQTVVTDWNRDGRDDLALAVATETGFSFVGLRANGTSFVATDLHASTIAFDRIKLAAGDTNGDGRGDVVMYARHEDGSPGTELRTYLSNGSALAGNPWLDDPALDWSTVEPY